MSRIPFSAQALLVCAAFLIVGIAVVDDYGVGWDIAGQLEIAKANLNYIRGGGGDILPDHDRFYGVAFELPLELLSRGLGLEDTRHILLCRHLLTHLFFLVAGFFGSLLVYRTFNSRSLALLALLLFLLHPRLYPASFYNSKDLPFLSMFMISLYMTHRAFRRDTVGAFLLCGVSVGILINLRIMGLMLFPAILAMRALDLAYGGADRRKHVSATRQRQSEPKTQARRDRRKHVLATGGAFAIAVPCTLYAISPYLWDSPFEIVTAVRTLAHHPTPVWELFQGRTVFSSSLPQHFVPTWIAISTPPVTLLLGVIGAATVCVRLIIRPIRVLKDPNLRFECLLLACFVLPILAVALLGSHLYDGWRLVFFLHAPFCLLGVIGLHWVGSLAKRIQPGVIALTGIGLLVTVVEMVQIHPHQYAYFNFFVDRTTPEHLRTQYEMDHRMNTYREGLVWLRESYPNTAVSVHDEWPTRKDWLILPQTDRRMLVLRPQGADFRIFGGKFLRFLGEIPPDNAVYIRKVYNNIILVVTRNHSP